MDNKEKLTAIEFAYIIVLTLNGGGNIYLFVKDTGEALVISERDMSLNKFMRSLPDSYSYINLNAIFKETFKCKFEIQDEYLLDINEEEFKVMEALRETDANKIHIFRRWI